MVVMVILILFSSCLFVVKPGPSAPITRQASKGPPAGQNTIVIFSTLFVFCNFFGLFIL